LPDKPRARQSAAEVAIEKQAKQDKKAQAAAAKQAKLNRLGAVEANMVRVGSGAGTHSDVPAALVKTVKNDKPKTVGVRKGKKATGKGKGRGKVADVDDVDEGLVESDSQPEGLVCKFIMR
jgi:hypothetical protein